MRWALERDYDVFTSSNESEAKSIFNSVKPPVVTLDLRLTPNNPEDLDGMQLLEQFLSDRPRDRIQENIFVGRGM